MGFIPYLWAILGLLFIVLEFLIPGFVIFFFGAGAVLTSILTAIIPFLQGKFLLQIAIWLASSVISLFALRRYFPKSFRGTVLNPDKDTTDSGAMATVAEKITPKKPGRIKYQGTTWNAECYEGEFSEGETVEILQKKNLTYIVKKSYVEELEE